MRRPTIVPQVPYQDIRAALSFLERAFGFREIPTARFVSEDGEFRHAMVEFGDGLIGIGSQGPHGAISPKSAGSRASSSACRSTTSMRTISVRSPRAHGSQTSCATTPGASAPTRRSTSRATAGASSQPMREVPQSEWRWRPGES